MLYQRKTLPSTNLGEPAPLPDFLVGLDDAVLADLSATLDPAAAQELGLVGQGFFPVADPPPPPVVPQSVSRMQAKLALLGAGKLTAAQAAVDAAASPALNIYWQDAPAFHRDHPEVLAIAGALGLTSDEVDALFIAAGAVT